MNNTIGILMVMLLQFVYGCKTKQSNAAQAAIKEQAVVYKTKADYSKLVPVLLSADKKEIVGYPAPKDVFRNGVLALPTALAKGYFLDNRGITPNSAFLNITYDEYAKLTAVPTLQELYNKITDKNPFEEIYNLGDRSRFKNEVKDLNKIIEKGDLKKFTRVK